MHNLGSSVFCFPLTLFLDFSTIIIDLFLFYHRLSTPPLCERRDVLRLLVAVLHLDQKGGSRVDHCTSALALGSLVRVI